MAALTLGKSVKVALGMKDAEEKQARSLPVVTKEFAELMAKSKTLTGDELRKARARLLELGDEMVRAKG